MSSMVERVAQALQQEMETAPFGEPPSSFALARAAIATMRKPTEAMIAAGLNTGRNWEVSKAWRAMIDAALE